jgi:hypothetical protein
VATDKRKFVTVTYLLPDEKADGYAAFLNMLKARGGEVVAVLVQDAAPEGSVHMWQEFTPEGQSCHYPGCQGQCTDPFEGFGTGEPVGILNLPDVQLQSYGPVTDPVHPGTEVVHIMGPDSHEPIQTIAYAVDPDTDEIISG